MLRLGAESVMVETWTSVTVSVLVGCDIIGWDEIVPEMTEKKSAITLAVPMACAFTMPLPNTPGVLFMVAIVGVPEETIVHVANDVMS